MKQIITSALYLLMIFALSYFVFEPANLYYELKWLDIPMHIMGGFGVVSLVAAILTYFGKPVSYLQVFIAYTIAAGAWELYEYIHDFVDYQIWNGWFDTTKDYLDGLLGASLAYLLIRK
jgi:hypothetical protein